MTLEHTDTFGGESNYSWVRRTTMPHEGLTNLAIVRRAKAWAGITGARCRVDRFGDMIAIWPTDLCQGVFITFED